MHRVIFLIVLFLQLIAFALVVGFFARLQLNYILMYSFGAYLLSIFLLLIAIITGVRGAVFNCVSVLFILINLLMYITILFASYLSDFIHGIKS